MSLNREAIGLLTVHCSVMNRLAIMALIELVLWNVFCLFYGDSIYLEKPDIIRGTNPKDFMGFV